MTYSRPRANIFAMAAASVLANVGQAAAYMAQGKDQITPEKIDRVTDKVYHGGKTIYVPRATAKSCGRPHIGAKQISKAAWYRKQMQVPAP